MNALARLNRAGRLAANTSLLFASLCVASTAAFGGAPNAGGTNFNKVSRPTAERLTPLFNTSVANARVMVPDGTSLYQVIGASETRWFAFEAEPGKTYVVDILDPYGDLGANVVGAVSVTDSGGTVAPPEANSNCTIAATNRAPGLEVPGGSGDGWRCIIRTLTPFTGATQNKRGIFVGVGKGAGIDFLIRVRESTIYGRWSTNGYRFHVELQNTTADSMCVEIVFNPSAGYSYSGGVWTVPGVVDIVGPLTVPAMGATTHVKPNSTPSGGQFHGTLRINDCGTGELVPNGLHVSTYAFNPVSSEFLYYFPNKANQGGQNSW